MSKSQPFEINWFAAAGSALGAVSSAVLLSTLGAAGTLIGAALGSIVITVGGSIYTQSLQKTKAHVDSRRGVERSRPDRSGATRYDGTGVSPAPLSPEPPRKPLGETLRGLPWKRIVALAVGLFVAVMAVILVFELSTGRPVSSFTGGTSETNTGTTLTDLGATSDNTDAEAPDEKPGEQPGEEPPASEPPASEPSADEKPTGEPAVEEKPTKEPAVEEKPADPPAPVEPPAEQQETDE